MEKIKIGFDARFITNRQRRGIGNYSLNIINELTKSYPNIEFILYVYYPDVETIFPSSSNITIRRILVPFYPLWEQIALPLFCYRDSIDILHCLGNTAPIFLSRKIKLVISLHDVIFLNRSNKSLSLGSNYQKYGEFYKSFIIKFLAKRVNSIITVSEYSKMEICKYIPSLKSESVNVIYQSCSNTFLIRQELNNQIILNFLNNNRYLLALGAEDPRKNTLTLVEAYLKLISTHSINEKLIIVGYKNWEKSESYRTVTRHNAKDKVLFLEYIEISDLAALYQHAILFVYPSLYEGFGIPILEAFSSGCPVIASNVSSIPEVGGNAALYFDPMNSNQIAQLIQTVIRDAKLRDGLVNIGFERIKLFTWTNAARNFMKIYKML